MMIAQTTTTTTTAISESEGGTEVASTAFVADGEEEDGMVDCSILPYPVIMTMEEEATASIEVVGVGMDDNRVERKLTSDAGQSEMDSPHLHHHCTATHHDDDPHHHNPFFLEEEEEAEGDHDETMSRVCNDHSVRKRNATDAALLDDYPDRHNGNEEEHHRLSSYNDSSFSTLTLGQDDSGTEDTALTVNLSSHPPIKLSGAAAATSGDEKVVEAVEAARRSRSKPSRVSWEDRIDQLKRYKEEHGDLLIPIRYKKNPSLGKFVHNTREQYKLYHKLTPSNYKKKCSLTAHRLAELNQIGFAWTTERAKKQNEDWEQRLEQLKTYKSTHGDCLVPHGYYDDPSFAEWIHRQRTTYAIHVKEGRTNTVVEDRMKKLEDLDFNFRVHVDKWSVHYEQLHEYHKQNGHCQVPTHYEANMKLGRWVNTQRHQRRLMEQGKKSTMTAERFQLLEDLDFSWGYRPSRLECSRLSWYQRFAQLVAFHKEHGHFGVSPAENAPLHAWCCNQKNLLMASIDAPTLPAFLSSALAATANGKNVMRTNSGNVKELALNRIIALTGIGFTKDVNLVPVLKNDDNSNATEVTL